jgi:tRNA(fMet)-specific endonuclease VapC
VRVRVRLRFHRSTRDGREVVGGRSYASGSFRSNAAVPGETLHGRSFCPRRRVGEDNVCTSIIVAAELRYGCAKRGSKRLLKAVEDILSEMAVLPFDVPADAEYGGIRSGLEAVGRLISSNDLLIAAHACASGATLVTANTDELNRVHGLRVENWLA